MKLSSEWQGEAFRLLSGTSSLRAVRRAPCDVLPAAFGQRLGGEVAQEWLAQGLPCLTLSRASVESVRQVGSMWEGSKSKPFDTGNEPLMDFPVN